MLDGVDAEALEEGGEMGEEDGDDGGVRRGVEGGG